MRRAVGSSFTLISLMSAHEARVTSSAPRSRCTKAHPDAWLALPSAARPTLGSSHRAPSSSPKPHPHSPSFSTSSIFPPPSLHHCSTSFATVSCRVCCCRVASSSFVLPQLLAGLPAPAASRLAAGPVGCLSCGNPCMRLSAAPSLSPLRQPLPTAAHGHAAPASPRRSARPRLRSARR
jgi:hypothetical protein